MKQAIKFASVVILAIALTGCAAGARRDLAKAVGIFTKGIVERATAPTQKIVRPGDNLWSISQTEYDTGFLWTKIYRDNRSQIQDPDIINIGQRLKISSVLTFNPDEVPVLIFQAQHTPPYKPHSTPRAELPLKY